SFLKEQKEKFEMMKKAKEEHEKYAKIDEERRKAQKKVSNSDALQKSLSDGNKFSLPILISDNENADDANPRESKRLKLDSGENSNDPKSRFRKYNPPQRKTKMLELSEVIKHQSLY